MEFVEALIKLWPIILVLVGCIVWNVRLEAKVLYLEKDHTDNKTMLWAKFDGIQVAVNSILQSVTRVETKLEMNKDNNKN